MKTILLCGLIGLFAASCHSKKSDEIDAGEETPDVVTPVTITHASTDSLASYIDLNATSTFLTKAVVKANVNGYVQSVLAIPGKPVSRGTTLFILKTKEAQSIGNTINLLDTSFKFSGIVSIRAGINGYVEEVNHQTGDYVQDGEQLSVISDAGSFVFLLNMPYELRPYVLNKKTVELALPDGKILTGNIASVMPTVDSASQTQQVVIKVSEKNLPINLIAKVRVVKTYNPQAVSLPKSSILSDETQSNFWVMKLINDSTAIKVPVVKGIETPDRVEITRPVFSSDDRFILTGNYGLPDTAKIKIQ